MNKLKTLLGVIYLILIITIIITFSFINKKNHLENNIVVFDIVGENIILGNNINLKGKTNTNIDLVKKVGKGFFIDKYHFITSSHIFSKKFEKYYIFLNNKFYKFVILKQITNSEIILGETKENLGIKYLLSSKYNINDDVYTIKNNSIIKGKIIKYNINLKEIGLNNLIKTNLKLNKGDSGSPLIKDNKIIGIFQIIDKNNNSYAEKIDINYLTNQKNYYLNKF